MKKQFALLTILVLLMTLLAACGGDGATPTSSVSEAAPSSQEESAAPESSESSQQELYSQNVDITNSTGVDILEFYISKSDVDDWEEDLLNGAVFAAGETMEFTTDSGETADTTWDILIVDEDGDEVSFMEINLSSATALELHWGPDGQTPTVTITGADDDQYYSQDLDIVNATGVAILELYISPSDDDMWGQDLLNGATIAPDETYHFETELVGTADATWDILIVDEDGDEVMFEDLNFSSTTTITLHWGPDGQTPTASMD